MRSFATPEGRTLVEWESEAVDVLKPDGSPLGAAWTFHLLEASGALFHTYTTMRFAIQEHHNTSAHVIEGDCLVSYSHDERWRHEHEPQLSRSPVICGLRLLAPTEAPTEADVRRAISGSP